MKVTADKIEDDWCTLIDGKIYKKFGPGIGNMLAAIDSAAKLQLPAKKIEMDSDVEKIRDKLTRILKR